ncbi:hypothetical protein JST56_04300 [Candidatus Dependentiae bacterium]|jgi:hypothetical protein|nr:hypothetical protein [Candidatus Dependentiae bacterium]
MNLKKIQIILVLCLLCFSSSPYVQTMTLDQSLGKLKGNLVVLKGKLQTLRTQLTDLAGKLGGGDVDGDKHVEKSFKADITTCLPKKAPEKVLSLPKTKENLQPVTIYHTCSETEKFRKDKNYHQETDWSRQKNVFSDYPFWFFPSTSLRTFHVIVGEQPNTPDSNYCGYHALFNAIHFIRYFTQVDINNLPDQGSNPKIDETIDYFSEQRGHVSPPIFTKKMVEFKKEILTGLGLKDIDASSSDLSPDYFRAIAAQDSDIRELIENGHFIFLPEATDQGVIDLDPRYITDVVAPSVDFFRNQKNAILTWAIGFNSTIFNGHFGTVCLVKQNETLYEFVCDSFNTYELLNDSYPQRALIQSIVRSKDNFISYFINKFIENYTKSLEQDYYLLFQKLVQFAQNKKIGEVRDVVSNYMKQALLAKINKQIQRSDGTLYPSPVQNYNHLGRPSVARELFNDNQYANIIEKQAEVKQALGDEAARYVDHLPVHQQANKILTDTLTDDFKRIVRGAGRVFKRLKIFHKIKAYFEGGNLESEVDTPDGFFDEFELENLNDPETVIKSFNVIIKRMSAADMSEYNPKDIHPHLKQSLQSTINKALSTTYKTTIIPEKAYEEIVDQWQKAAWALYAVKNYIE